MASNSIFIRPASPPPRAPSPDFVPAPLPSPPVRNHRQRTTSLIPKPSTSSLSGLDRSLFSARSCSNLREAATSSNDSALKRKSSRATIDSAKSSSPPTTPRSLPLPSPAPSKRSKSRHHRSHSIIIPHRRSGSPPPTPSPREPPPPVPPVPVVLLTPTDKKPVLHPQPTRITPIYLPELDNLSPISDAPNPFLSQKLSPPSRVHKGHRSRDSRGIAMTCLKFFSLRNPYQSSTSTAVAV